MLTPISLTDNDNRPDCPKCNSTATKLGAGKGPHTASLSCAGCNRWIKWIGKAELAKFTGGAK